MRAELEAVKGRLAKLEAIIPMVTQASDANAALFLGELDQHDRQLAALAGLMERLARQEGMPVTEDTFGPVINWDALVEGYMAAKGFVAFVRGLVAFAENARQPTIVLAEASRAEDDGPYYVDVEFGSSAAPT